MKDPSRSPSMLLSEKVRGQSGAGRHRSARLRAGHRRPATALQKGASTNLGLMWGMSLNTVL